MSEDQNLSETFIKVIVIGDSGVGKTNLIHQILDKDFQANFPATIAVDMSLIEVRYKGSLVKIQLWDTAGQEKYKTITSLNYKDSRGIILVYDISDHNTFLNLHKWLEDSKQNINNDVKCLMIGNKSDLEDKRKVTQEEALQFAEQHEVGFFETSAKTNTDKEIKLNFEKFVQEICDDFDLVAQASEMSKLTLQESVNKDSKKKSCKC